MIRISSDSDAGPSATTVAGRLEASHVAELEGYLQAREGTLILDLSELQGADAGAVCWLRGFVRRGGRILGASPYIRCLLEKADDSGKTRQETDAAHEREA